MQRIHRACVIDDDEIFLYWTTKVMQELNFCDELLVYRNGEEAINALAASVEKGGKLPEILLLDLNMPVLDGWNFLKKFIKLTEKTGEKVRVYVVTSSVDLADLIKAKQFPIVHNYLLKPLTIDTLMEIKGSFGVQSLKTPLN
ncbi:MAG: response regulator [Allomuricauda sp.]|nr:MAG: response regulator [Allomuricauda sp.]